MRAFLSTGLIMALALICGRALAESYEAAPTKSRDWAVAARTSYAYLGPKERPTGGMVVGADATRSWPIGSVSRAR